MQISNRICILTWNVKSSPPLENLNNLFGVHDYSECNDLPDLYAVGFQELSVNPLSLLVEDPWVDAVIKTLKKWEYVMIKRIRLQGILLALLCKRRHLTILRDIETSYVRTGLGGYWGNKGGVCVRFSVNGSSVCLVNSHLAAHDNQVQQRINDYNAIIDNITFTNAQTFKVLLHDYVFWFGDLNFRLNEISSQDVHEIIQRAKSAEDTKVKQNCIDELLSKDQLLTAIREGKAFSEFEETVPTFLPTYRFKAKTDEYDYTSRKPAFTDRILYRFTPNVYNDVKLHLKQRHYSSHSEYKQSDHKPVTSLFSIKVFTRKAMSSMNLEEPLNVTFAALRNWRISEDSLVWYKVSIPISRSDNETSRVLETENVMKRLSGWDWIGLFRSDFASLDDYICYTWASVNPLNSGPSNATVLSDEGETCIEDTGGSWFKVLFSEQVVLAPDTYRLLYVTQKGDVLGMSSPFDVTTQ